MTTTSPTKTSSEATNTALAESYREAISKEGFMPSDDLVALVARYHRATLTAGLVLRAFHALRQARKKQTNQSTPAATSARS